MGEVVILSSSGVGFLRSDGLEERPAAREAAGNQDGKFQENRARAANKCVK